MSLYKPSPFHLLAASFFHPLTFNARASRPAAFCGTNSQIREAERRLGFLPLSGRGGRKTFSTDFLSRIHALLRSSFPPPSVLNFDSRSERVRKIESILSNGTRTNGIGERSKEGKETAPSVANRLDCSACETRVVRALPYSESPRPSTAFPASRVFPFVSSTAFDRLIRWNGCVLMENRVSADPESLSLARSLGNLVRTPGPH